MTFDPNGSEDWGDPKKNACLKYIYFACLLNFLLLVWNGFYYTLTGMRKKRGLVILWVKNVRNRILPMKFT